MTTYYCPNIHEALRRAKKAGRGAWAKQGLFPRAVLEMWRNVAIFTTAINRLSNNKE